MNGVFITATDTEVGKTVICGLLARYLMDKGYNTVTQKWIQTGSLDFPQDLASHLELMGKSRDNIKASLPYMAPYTFQLPASPHLAAESEKINISAGKIKDSFRQLANKFDFVIVEGIGGVLVPFNRKELVIDIAGELGLPVIIVAANRLGAINHTLLTVEAVKARGMKILGIVFNSQCQKENDIILEDNPKIIMALTGERISGTLPRSDDRNLLRKAFVPIGDNIFTGLEAGLQNG